MATYKYKRVSNLRRVPAITLHVSSPSDPTIKDNVDAIIDTGAVMTCVPQKLIEDMGEENFDYSFINARGPFDKGSSTKVFVVDLRLDNCLFEDIEVIAYPRDFALIGRDIINGYKITLDAPNDSWEVDTDCS